MYRLRWDNLFNTRRTMQLQWFLTCQYTLAVIYSDWIYMCWLATRTLMILDRLILPSTNTHPQWHRQGNNNKEMITEGLRKWPGTAGVPSLVSWSKVVSSFLNMVTLTTHLYLQVDLLHCFGRVKETLECNIVYIGGLFSYNYPTTMICNTSMHTGSEVFRLNFMCLLATH